MLPGKASQSMILTWKPKFLGKYPIIYLRLPSNIQLQTKCLENYSDKVYTVDIPRLNNCSPIRFSSPLCSYYTVLVVVGNQADLRSKEGGIIIKILPETKRLLAPFLPQIIWLLSFPLLQIISFEKFLEPIKSFFPSASKKVKVVMLPMIFFLFFLIPQIPLY